MGQDAHIKSPLTSRDSDSLVYIDLEHLALLIGLKFMVMLDSDR